MKVDSTSKAFLHYLTAAIESMPDDARPKFACLVLQKGLMRLPFILRIMRWILGDAKFFQRLAIVYSHKREFCDHFYKGFLNWMIEGKDAYDAKSVGGFSQKELEEIVELMKTFGWETDPT